MAGSVGAATDQGVISTQIARVQNDQPQAAAPKAAAPVAANDPAPPPPPPPADTGRGSVVDTSA